ncbi:AAA family ATPase [Bradyrhizobium diazoefficiens]|nr:adenylate/guanylate cyclase domain-containing protein [Bradyrhizobium diazoefficiens]QQN63449.1 AAA family ATPase [Bradyrhizobium diazoefficiens]
MQSVAEWLADIGLEQYVQRFGENDVDLSMLRYLTDADLDKMGVSLGHRRKMLAAIAAAPKQDDAQRRLLTVMFTDLVGSTALSTRVDPEELRSIMSAYQRCVADVVGRFDGFVAKYMGDGVLAYFGYPQAHEDDAERAVRTGLALLEAVARLPSDEPLQVRVGIASGLVVVGDLIGAGEAQERAVVGATPNLAARLQAVAAPGTIVIGSQTRHLLAGLFEYEQLGGVEVKGFGAPVDAYRVVRPSSIESRFEAMHAATTPLVGREQEIALLQRRWEQAKRGDGCVVLMSGESGIGKSRIAQFLLEWTGSGPHTNLRFFCSPLHQDSALYPTITQIERAAGLRRDDSDEERLGKLEALIGYATSDLNAAIPLMADLLAIPMGDRYARLTLTPQKRKEKTLEVLLGQVEGLAARRPVLMVVEDVHWSDPTTRELLNLLVERITALRGLAIITFRPEFVPPWIDIPGVTLITLDRLGRDDVEMMVGMNGGRMLPREICEEIVQRTDGVPLFVEELTKTILESGVFSEPGRYGNKTTGWGIPTTLRGSLLARLDRLSPTREVAQLGAALGRQFSYELISAVASIPRSKLEDALSQLVSAELILCRGEPPDAEYTFKHALVQEAAYDTLLRSRRQQLHGRIADALETQFPDIVVVQPDLIARHCAEAGLTAKAITYYLKAGQNSMARWAMTEAAAQLRKGLALLPQVREASERAEHELSLQIALGQALQATKGYAAPESGEAYARARELCHPSTPPLQLWSVLIGQFVFRFVRAELEQAEQIAYEIRRVAEMQDQPLPRVGGLTTCGNVYCWQGRFTDARPLHEQALALWDSSFRELLPVPEDTFVLVSLKLARTLLCLGHIDQAREHRDNGLMEARSLSPFTQAMALYLNWFIDMPIQRPTSAMLGSADEVIAISNEQGFPLWLAAGKIMRGWCLGGAGKATEGVALIQEGVDLCTGIGSRLGLPAYLAAMAETYGRAGQPEKGLDQLAHALTIIDATGERWAEAEIHRLQGNLLRATGDDTGAQASYDRALRVAQGQSAKLWELRTALDLARLWRDRENYAEAHDLLAAKYGWFAEGLEAPLLVHAKALLGQLER